MIALNHMLEKFQSGDIGPIVQAATLRVPETWPAARWSLKNRILAYAEADTLSVRGFRQWEQVSRNVKKGTCADVYIYGPILKKDDKTGDETARIVGYCLIPMFSEKQTEGQPITEQLTPTNPPPLLEVAHRLNLKVEYMPLPPDRLGDYCGPRQRIHLATDDEHVFFHELAHAAHAATDPNYRQVPGEQKEVIAEFSACVIASLYGYDYSGNAWHYISMSDKDPLRAVTAALTAAEKVLNLILA